MKQINTQADYEQFVSRSVKCMNYDYTAFLPSKAFLEANKIRIIDRPAITLFDKQHYVTSRQIVPGYTLTNNYTISVDPCVDNIENVLKEYAYIFSIEPTYSSNTPVITNGEQITLDYTYKVRGILKIHLNFTTASNITIGRLHDICSLHTLSNTVKDEINLFNSSQVITSEILRRFKTISSININDEYSHVRVVGELHDCSIYYHDDNNLEKYHDEYLLITGYSCAYDNVPPVKFFKENQIALAPDSKWLVNKYGQFLKNKINVFDITEDNMNIEKLLLDFYAVTAIIKRDKDLLIAGVTNREATLFNHNYIEIENSNDFSTPIIDITILENLVHPDDVNEEDSKNVKSTIRYVAKNKKESTFIHMGAYKVFKDKEDLFKSIQDNFTVIYRITQLNNNRVIVTGVLK